MLVLFPLSFCSTLRGPFRRHFRRRTCPSRALHRVHRLHALYDCHSLIRFVNSYVVIIFVYVHESFAEKGLPMLWCSSSRAQVGCLVDSATPFEVENRVSLQSRQDACYSNTHNLDEEGTSHQKVMQFILPEVCVCQLNCTRQHNSLVCVRECHPPLQQSIARWFHFKKCSVK